MDTTRVVKRAWLAVISLTIIAVAGAQAWAAPISVTVNTAALASSPAQLAFNLIDGGPRSNSVTISVFATDGTLGSATTECVGRRGAH